MAQFNVGLQKMVKQASLSLEVDRTNKLQRYAGRLGRSMNDVLRDIVCPAIDALEIPESDDSETKNQERRTRNRR